MDAPSQPSNDNANGLPTPHTHISCATGAAKNDGRYSVSPHSYFHNQSHRHKTVNLITTVALNLTLLFTLLIISDNQLCLRRHGLRQIISATTLRTIAHNKCYRTTGATVACTARDTTHGKFDAGTRQALTVRYNALIANGSGLQQFDISTGGSRTVQIITRRSIPEDVTSKITTLFSARPLPSHV